jgi:hypothetical protein
MATARLSPVFVVGERDLLWRDKRSKHVSFSKACGQSFSHPMFVA